MRIRRIQALLPPTTFGDKSCGICYASHVFMRMVLSLSFMFIKDKKAQHAQHPEFAQQTQYVLHPYGTTQSINRRWRWFCPLLQLLLSKSCNTKQTQFYLLMLLCRFCRRMLCSVLPLVKRTKQTLFVLLHNFWDKSCGRQSKIPNISFIKTKHQSQKLWERIPKPCLFCYTTFGTKVV